MKEVVRVSNYPIIESVSLPLFSAAQTEYISTEMLRINILSNYQAYQLLHSFNGWPRLVAEFIILLK